MFIFSWLFWAINYYRYNNSVDKELQVAHHISNDLKNRNNQFEYSFPNYKKAVNVAFYLLELDQKPACKITYDNGTIDSVMKKDLNNNQRIFIERLD